MITLRSQKRTLQRLAPREPTFTHRKINHGH